MNIEWKYAGAYRYANVKTKSGLKASISEVQRTRPGQPLFSLYIEGEKTCAATRATLEKINQILESK